MAYAVVNSTSPFLQTTPGRDWIKVGYLNMTDPTQECPNSWQKITSPRSSCRKKSSAPCDSLNITTSGASYQTVCGWFRGYQIGTTDAFANIAGLGYNLETYYVDGVSVTYGSPGNRRHVYTYAVGIREANFNRYSCPCTGGDPIPSFVGSDYYCESGNPGPSAIGNYVYSSDVLWDGQQCGGDESTCCNPPDLPWFCKTFPTPISEDLEVRICTDQELNDENVAIESFELYIQVADEVETLKYENDELKSKVKALTDHYLLVSDSCTLIPLKCYLFVFEEHSIYKDMMCLVFAHFIWLCFLRSRDRH
eukprot:Em0001g3802a